MAEARRDNFGSCIGAYINAVYYRQSLARRASRFPWFRDGEPFVALDATVTYASESRLPAMRAALDAPRAFVARPEPVRRAWTFACYRPRPRKISASTPRRSARSTPTTHATAPRAFCAANRGGGRRRRRRRTMASRAALDCAAGPGSSAVALCWGPHYRVRAGAGRPPAEQLARARPAPAAPSPRTWPLRVVLLRRRPARARATRARGAAPRVVARRLPPAPRLVRALQPATLRCAPHDGKLSRLGRSRLSVVPRRPLANLNLNAAALVGWRVLMASRPSDFPSGGSIADVVSGPVLLSSNNNNPGRDESLSRLDHASRAANTPLRRKFGFTLISRRGGVVVCTRQDLNRFWEA